MDLDLTLSALKFANVSTFSRNFGTKKNGSQNGGSLTTEEFNIANAIPFDKMRPIEITENSRTGNVEFDANLVINQSNVTLTINDGTYKGVKVNVFAQTAGNVVHDTNVTDSLQAGERASYQWNGTGWDYVGGTPLGALNYTALCSTALGTAKAVSIPGFTLKTGTTIEVLFANGFYGSASSDTMTLNVNSIGAKKIYACRHGSKIALAPHSCTRDESGDATAHYWFIQANTCLKLMYDATLDSNNGGWLILGNPIVLSASDTNSSYTVYADGYIKQFVRYNSVLTSAQFVWINLPISYSDTNYGVISIGNIVSGDADDFEVCAGISKYQATGDVKTVNSFRIRAYEKSRVEQRDNFTYGY